MTDKQLSDMYNAVVPVEYSLNTVLETPEFPGSDDYYPMVEALIAHWLGLDS